MMHYLAEVLAQHGVSAAAVRSELRRAADAASIDLGDVTLEVERLVASVERARQLADVGNTILIARYE